MTIDPDEDITLVVGPLVADLAAPSNGSMKWDADCGHQVWLSPSTQKCLVQYQHGGERYEVMCQDCALKVVRELEDSP